MAQARPETTRETEDSDFFTLMMSFNVKLSDQKDLGLSGSPQLGQNISHYQGQTSRGELGVTQSFPMMLSGAKRIRPPGLGPRSMLSRLLHTDSTVFCLN